jgi:hypothetical protein
MTRGWDIGHPQSRTSVPPRVSRHRDNSTPMTGGLVSRTKAARRRERIALYTSAALFCWFFILDTVYVGMFTSGKLGVDGALYTEAARAWLSGADPYAVTLTGVPFGATPPALLMYAPFTILPQILVGPVTIGLSLAAGIWTLRRLGLPFWWIAFPPMATSIALGNAQPIVLGLLLVGGGGPVLLATALKAYAAVVPLVLGQWRPLVWTAVGLAVTFPFLPWVQFLENGGYASRFATFVHSTSAPAFGPELTIVTIIALGILGRKTAAWFAIPALWPSTQDYYTLFALPALRPWTAALVAIPLPGMVPAVLILMAAISVVQRVRMPQVPVLARGS